MKRERSKKVPNIRTKGTEPKNDPFKDIQVKRFCGYVALNLTEHSPDEVLGWLYLRRHSDTQIFVGNLPIPPWLPYFRSSDHLISPEHQKRLKEILRKLFPSADSVDDIFSTNNGRLATRITMKSGKAGVRETLESPADHLYMEYWRQLHNEGEQGTSSRYLKEYHESRDVEKVLEWSNAAMKSYEAREQQRKEEQQLREKLGKIPDEDGFVTVTNGAKQVKASEAQAITSRKGRFKNRGTKRARNLLDTTRGIEKDGFYRWQRRRDNTVTDLQKKFRDDRKRIAAIRGLTSE